MSHRRVHDGERPTGEVEHHTERLLECREVSRRQVLGAAAALGVTGLVLTRQSSTLLATSAESDESGAREASSDATRTLPAIALVDGSFLNEELASARRMLSPLDASVLGPDLLWDWRAGLGQQLSQGVTAVAITRWDKAIVLSGLAREARLPIRQERIGHSVFRTEIG